MQEASAGEAQALAHVELLGDCVSFRSGTALLVRELDTQSVELAQDISVFAADGDVGVLRGRRHILLAQVVRELPVYDPLRRRSQIAKEGEMKYK